MQLATVEPEPLDAKLARCGARFTPVRLELAEDMAKEAWAEIGCILLRREQVMQWWIGDWATFGAGDERAEGWRKRGALKEFCEVNGFSYQNVANKCYVSGNIHLSLRRENLPWSIYAEVAPLKPKDQRTWLDKAAKQGLSVSNLRREIRLSNCEFNALENEGISIELGTKHYDDLDSWCRRKPPEFWTQTRKAIWVSRISDLLAFVQQRPVM